MAQAAARDMARTARAVPEADVASMAPRCAPAADLPAAAPSHGRPVCGHDDAMMQAACP